MTPKGPDRKPASPQRRGARLLPREPATFSAFVAALVRAAEKAVLGRHRKRRGPRPPPPGSAP
jgi:hypothetical protein